MRILHIIHSIDPLKGGTTAALRTLAGACSANGHASPVVTLDAPGSPWLASWETPVLAAGPAHTHYGWSAGLRKALQSELPAADLAVIHGLWQYHNSAVRRLCLAVGRKYIVFPHGMLDPWALRQHWFKRLYKLCAWWLQTRETLRSAAAVAFTTEDERDAARPALRGLDVRSEILPPGVDRPPMSREALKEEFLDHHPEFAGRRVILFLGRLHSKKGCDLLLEGYARWLRHAQIPHPETVHLRMAGPASSDEYGAFLRRMTAQSGLDDRHVSFPGMMTGAEKWRELANAEVLVLPSHQENYGIVVGESVACGTPVLLSDKVNTWRQVTDGGAGFAAPPSAVNVESLIQKWFGLDERERRAMSTAATRLFESYFSAQASASEFLSVCKKIVTGARQEGN